MSAPRPDDAPRAPGPSSAGSSGGPSGGSRSRSSGTGGSGRSTATGPGRVLVAVYAVFALSASARAGVQLLRDGDEAPLAYGLSAFAAVVYLVATVALARSERRLALLAVTIELVGVLAVGALSVLDPGAFPRATVWSGFGSGYGYVPLVLPVLGLVWLRRSRRVGSAAAPPSGPPSGPPSPSAR